MLDLICSRSFHHETQDVVVQQRTTMVHRMHLYFAAIGTEINASDGGMDDTSNDATAVLKSTQVRACSLHDERKGFVPDIPGSLGSTE